MASRFSDQFKKKKTESVMYWSIRYVPGIFRLTIWPAARVLISLNDKAYSSFFSRLTRLPDLCIQLPKATVLSRDHDWMGLWKYIFCPSSFSKVLHVCKRPRIWEIQSVMSKIRSFISPVIRETLGSFWASDFSLVKSKDWNW